MVEFTSPSGVTVKINPADWVDAVKLKNAIVEAFAQSGAALDLGTKIEASGAFLKAAMMVDSSPKVYDALWPCLIRCTYGGVKITPETFNPVKAREDYYPIVMACIKENHGPLFASLFSMFKELLPKPQASESQV
jgi:hypothetical protein